MSYTVHTRWLHCTVCIHVGSFCFQVLSAKGCLPRERRGKERTLPVKQQVGGPLVYNQMLYPCFNPPSTCAHMLLRVVPVPTHTTLNSSFTHTHTHTHTHTRTHTRTCTNKKKHAGYQISFTLINPDPSQIHAYWNIEEATESELMMLVNKILRKSRSVGKD